MVSKKVYIAPDGFVAFIDRGHNRHVHAAAFFRYFAQEHYQLYTSMESMNDAYNDLYKNISPSLAKDFLRAMYMSTINIVYPESSHMKTAIKTIISSTAVELTYSKALMAVICNKQSIPQICTFEYLHSLFGLQQFYLPI